MSSLIFWLVVLGVIFIMPPAEIVLIVLYCLGNISGFWFTMGSLVTAVPTALVLLLVWMQSVGSR